MPQSLVMAKESLVEQFNYLAKNPPGGDEYASAFYTAATELLSENQRWTQLFEEIQDRRQITHSHLVNLVLRVAQSRLMDSPDYPEKFDKQIWKESLGQILEDDWEGFLQDMLTKDTGTTIYRRYAGLKSIAGALFPESTASKGLRVLDIGCGRNYGLRGLALNIPFGDINIHSLEIETWLNRPFKVVRGIAVDRVDYRTEEAKKWAMACGFRPGELRKYLPQVLELERQLEQSEGIEFYPTGFEELLARDLDLNNIDIIMASTMLYQAPEGQHHLFQVAQEILSPNGVLLIQDFAAKDAKGEFLEFRNDWSTPYSYRTFVIGAFCDWRPIEVEQWKDGRCWDVQPGEDFAMLIEESELRKKVKTN